MKSKIFLCLFFLLSKVSVSAPTVGLPINESSKFSNSNISQGDLLKTINDFLTNYVITDAQATKYWSDLNALENDLVASGGAAGDAWGTNFDDETIWFTYLYWYNYIFSKSLATSGSSDSDITKYITDAMASDTIMVTSTGLYQDEVTYYSGKVNDLKNEIAAIETAQETAKEDLNAARQSAFSTFSTADLFMRGRLGTVTNKTSIAYQLVASDGTVLDTIEANQTSSNTYDLSDSRYCNTELGSMLKLVPYDAVQIQEGTALGTTTGGTVVILCNSTGTNQPGNPYGYSQEVTISRVYPSAATRAHTVDIGSLVSSGQYWQIDFEINPLGNPSSDDTSVEVIFPRISMVETVSLELDVTKDLPDVLDAVMDTKTSITRSNSSASDSHPSWDSIPEFWTDLSA